MPGERDEEVGNGRVLETTVATESGGDASRGQKSTSTVFTTGGVKLLVRSQHHLDAASALASRPTILDRYSSTVVVMCV